MWIASRNDWAYDWSQAGCSIRMEPAGYWWAAAPDEQLPEDETLVAEIQAKFQGEHGDRHQALVFIGNAMDEQRIRRILDECLLSDLEYVQGPAYWAKLEDPLPPIELVADENPRWKPLIVSQIASSQALPNVGTLGLSFLAAKAFHRWMADT